jgi:mono/diheme cytochrome c family protein
MTIAKNSLSSAKPPRTTAALWLFVGLGLLLFLMLAFALFYRKPVPPVPESIAGDELLVLGHELYHSRCVSCHGVAGRGDGPIAKTAGATPPGDLTAERWKHGDSPQQVLLVISKGVRGTGMSGWSGTFDERELRAVAAFVFHLGQKEIPSEYRAER